MIAPRRRAPASSSEQAPRLVLRFAIFTACGLALAAAALVFVVRQQSLEQSQQQALDRTELAAEALSAHKLRPADLRRRVPRKRRLELDRLLGAGLLLGGIVDLTLYSSEGRVTYTTAPGASERPLPRSRVEKALAGRTTSEVGVSSDGSRVLRTYAPVVLGPTGTPGVVALEHDHARIETAARRSSLLIAVVLEGLLLLLFLLLAPMLMRVASRIRQQIAELERAATHDDLLGVQNRLGFGRAIEEAVAGRTPGAVLLIDVDGFSKVNEGLGSERGDALLGLIVERLTRTGEDRSAIARVGEDEFGLVLPAARRAEIATVAAQVEAAVAEPFLVGGVRVAVTVSFGAAYLPEHGTDPDTLLRRASMALSTAKQPGQRKLQIYDPDHEASDVSRLALVAELREALHGGQLLVHYQPQVDLGTNVVSGVEALVRWQHPKRGLLTPHHFIAQAERGGLGTEVRAFVLETAARQWQRWKAVGIELELAVNLSTVDMLDGSLPNEIATLLEHHGVPPRNLVLEITERTLVGDEQRTGRIVDDLAQLGVRLALDDFGTGQSSLASLRQFPVQQIKLDRALLACVSADPAARVIFRSCVEIAHAIGATVVAEGVETQAQRSLARALGCDLAQGYLIGKALPPDELTPVLEQVNAGRRGIAA